MPAYLVRLIKNRDIVGIFVADELEELIEAVDECTDIDACEFAELPPGGIMWTGPAIAVPVERPPPSEEDKDPPFPDFPWERVTLSETWFDELYGYNEDQMWEPFVPSAPKDPDPTPSPRPMGPAQVISIKERKRG